MHNPDSLIKLAHQLQDWGQHLGFSRLGISRAELGDAPAHLQAWLAAGRHGEMDYMARHAALRSHPQTLVPGTLTVISATLDYWPETGMTQAQNTLANPELAYLSRYALGRDYHKTVRSRLQKLAERLQAEIGEFGYRVFSDSAPVMEVALAQSAGLGWRGKHTLLLTRKGSWHFLGEIYTNLPLPPTLSGAEGEERKPQASTAIQIIRQKTEGQTPHTQSRDKDHDRADQDDGNHCGRCTACLSACPTGAIIAPYQVDARLCISYLTIELAGSIPIPLRPLMGNRIYGCDDCQLCCPWNRFAQIGDPDFAPRHGLADSSLAALMHWSETEFLERLAGSPIRRIGHERWLRNIAVALGNGPASPGAIAALQQRMGHPSPLVREHTSWALAQLQARGAESTPVKHASTRQPPRGLKPNEAK